MTAEECLIQASNFVFSEGVRVEEHYKYLCRLRMLQKDGCLDCLDLLEVMEAKHRLEYWNELQRHFQHLFSGY